MLKKIIFGGLILACIVAGIYWFTYTKQVSTPVGEGINAIPNSAAIIFEIKQPSAGWKKLSQTNIMWEELLGTETFATLNKQALYADSVLQHFPAVSKFIDERPLYISVHPSQNKFDFLFTYALPNLTHQSELDEVFEKLNAKNKNLFSYSFIDGTLLISSNKALVDEAQDQLKKATSLSSDKNFNKIYAAAGKNVDANIYVNYKLFLRTLNPFLSKEANSSTASLSALANYSGWDVALKPNSVMLSGFTSVNDSAAPHFLNLFEKQKPQHIELTKIIPAKTAIMLFYGISNTKTFLEDHKKYSPTKISIDKGVEESFYGWLDNELALVITESNSGDLSENSYAVLHSNTITEAERTLAQLTNKLNENQEKKIDTSNFMDHTINYLPIRELLPTLFGSIFNNVKENYFTSVDDYIVFGNSEKALQNFIQQFEANKTLGNDKNYQAFAENISSETNLYLYTSIARSPSIYSSFLNSESANDIKTHLELFHKFEAAGIQFTSNNKLFYSNIYLKYNPEFKKETGTLWECKLDTTVSAKPFLVINHNTKAKEVVVQDDANKIYLISNTGKIIWTKQLHEKIMSDVMQIDVLKNDKLQLLFNTSSTIYLFDRNGNDMKGFPIKLKSPATNAISVVDYENNRDYRLFIATENKKILCYKPTGELVSGFKFDKTVSNIYTPIQYFNANNKDHLCAIDVKGKIYILDRHGDTRIKIKEQMAQGIRNFFVETGKDYSRSYIVAADTMGNVIKISLNGDKERIKLQDFETSPYFDYRDINNDKTKEYIFLTRNELKVFNQDKTLLFDHTFTSKISQTPQFFLFPDGTGKIGVVSESTNEVFLFDNNGSLTNTFPLNGRTPFSIGDLNNEGNFNLVTGSADHSIFVYQLQ